jgi:hypothetical protein
MIMIIEALVIWLVGVIAGWCARFFALARHSRRNSSEEQKGIANGAVGVIDLQSLLLFEGRTSPWPEADHPRGVGGCAAWPIEGGLLHARPD